MDYEVVVTYLNGCAGEAYPITDIEEMKISDPESFLREKFGKDYACFVREELSPVQTRFRFDNGTVVYIYEFTRLD